MMRNGFRNHPQLGVSLSLPIIVVSPKNIEPKARCTSTGGRLPRTLKAIGEWDMGTGSPQNQGRPSKHAWATLA